MKYAFLLLAIVAVGVFSGFLWISGSSHDNAFTTTITSAPQANMPTGLVHITKFIGNKTHSSINVPYYTVYA